MDTFDKSMAPLAYRGCIFSFSSAGSQAGTGDREILVISGDSRAADRKVGMLMLGTSDRGHDAVPIRVPGIGVRYAHCGMTTYCDRSRLESIIGQASEEEMRQVDRQLAVELGLADSVTIANAETKAWKEAFGRLLETMDGARPMAGSMFQITGGAFVRIVCRDKADPQKGMWTSMDSFRAAWPGCVPEAGFQAVEIKDSELRAIGQPWYSDIQDAIAAAEKAAARQKEKEEDA